MNTESGAAQAAAWKSTGGNAWVEAQALLDGMFLPFEQRLVAAAVARPRRGVLDIGCGTGATTLAVARALGAPAGCVGVDISEPMLSAARARAQRESLPAEFVLADAQTCAFEAGSVDLVMSRFGVMFFADPVAAFANLRRAARDAADLCLIVWRGPQDNPFMTTAERAASPLLPALGRRETGAPGQFGLGDPQQVRGILQDSGWSAIDIAPLDAACAFPAAQLPMYLSRLGPLGRILPEVAEPLRSEVLATVRAAFEPYVQGDTVRFNAACWMIGARASA
ncbi:MAG TPA: class I SAM-dependent methyltransferase [Fontimonas sp.]